MKIEVIPRLKQLKRNELFFGIGVSFVLIGFLELFFVGKISVALQNIFCKGNEVCELQIIEKWVKIFLNLEVLLGFMLIAITSIYQVVKKNKIEKNNNA